MSILLDIMGSTIIGSIVMLLLFNNNSIQVSGKHSSDTELRMQQSAKTLAEIISSDFRKIGYNYDGISLITIESKKISFYGDIDSNKVVDQVTYYLSDSTLVSNTENPIDKVLIRVVNNDTSKGPSLGITDLKFSYRNNFGINTTVLDSIRYIKVEFWVEAPERVNNTYPFTYWEMTITPRNI